MACWKVGIDERFLGCSGSGYVEEWWGFAEVVIAETVLFAK